MKEKGREREREGERERERESCLHHHSRWDLREMGPPREREGEKGGREGYGEKEKQVEVHECEKRDTERRSDGFFRWRDGEPMPKLHNETRAMGGCKKRKSER